MSDPLFVSVVMAVRNEANFIEQALRSLLSQDYPQDRMEIIIADGMSNDGTIEIIEGIQRQHPCIRLIENERKIAPCGLNKAIQQARGEILIRMDGHTCAEPGYVAACVSLLQKTDAENVGGQMRCRGETYFENLVSLATSSPFGVGDGRFHYSEQEEWVDTVYLGAWRREAFEKNGYFDEELVRNQDDEWNYRLRKNGGKILLSPRIRSTYKPRSSFYSLSRQYFQYGFWKVRVFQKHPRQMRWSHFVPPVFVGSLVGTFFLGLFVPPFFKAFTLVGGAYVVANLAASLQSAFKKGWRYFPFLPFVYSILHFAYGAGFLLGLVRFAHYWGDAGKEFNR